MYGRVLSILTLLREAVRSCEPEESYDTARRSYVPSPTVFVTKLAAQGEVESCAIVVQLSAPALLRWKSTLATLRSPVALSVTVSESGLPGLAKVSVPPTTALIVTGSPVKTLPALSVTLTRSSKLPARGGVHDTA